MRARSKVAIAVALLAVTLAGVKVWAHGGKHHGPALRGPVSAEEKSAFARAKPVFEEHCARCHTTKGRKAKPKSLAHFNMDRYPFKGHHAHEAGQVIRRVLTDVDGKGPSMPDDDPGAVKGEQLERVLAWATVFERAHPAPQPEQKPAHEHH